MSADPRSHVGYGLYFIDVLACVLFCLALALVAARFGREQTVAVDLPEMAASERAGTDLSGSSITVRGAGDAVSIELDGERVSLAELDAQLRATRPLSVVLRSEASPLSEVVAIAHGAGVHEIRLAYDATEGPP